MLKKLICKLLGHIRTMDYFTGEYGKEVINPITMIPNPVPIMVRKDLEKCPRCGIKL